jgi:poly(beta-D-mannuronate) lyase
MISAHYNQTGNMGKSIGKKSHFGCHIERIAGILCFVAILVTVLGHGVSFSAVINVGSISELNNAIANASAGDEIILADGTYTSQGRINFDARAVSPLPTEETPITVRANTPGRVIITGGNSSVSIRGTYLIFAGFHFRDITSTGVLMELVAATHCRITNCLFERVNKTGGVIEVRGLNSDASQFVGSSTYNQVDHCTFQNNRRVQIENFIVNHPRYVSPDLGNMHNTYSHNHFLNHVESSQEEAFQIGRGSDGYAAEFSTDAYITIEYNLFENYHGDNELISNKSSSNTYRNNVVVNCMGALQIRGGDDCIIDGNIFYEDGSSDAQYYKGILTQGTGHRITNNYVEGPGSVIGIRYGNSGSRPNSANVTVANNTIRDSNRGYCFITGSEVAPRNITFLNNVGESSVNVSPMFGRGYGGSGHIWQGNRGYVASGDLSNSSIPVGGVFNTGSYELTNQRTDYVVNYRYPENYNNGVNFGLSVDLEGRPRDNPPSVGAFEGQSRSPVRAMLQQNEVGVDWSVSIPDSGEISRPTGLRIVNSTSY